MKNIYSFTKFTTEHLISTKSSQLAVANIEVLEQGGDHHGFQN